MKNYDTDRPFADILAELAYRVRFAVVCAVGGWLHRLNDRVWDMAPSKETGLAGTVWNGALALTDRAADSVDRLA
jgi:hypothetical protein